MLCNVMYGIIHNIHVESEVISFYKPTICYRQRENISPLADVESFPFTMHHIVYHTFVDRITTFNERTSTFNIPQ